MVFFGLASAVAWGVGDFAGSIASRRSFVVTTLAAVQWVGLVLALAAAALSRESLPPVDALIWAAVAGISGCIGLGLFFAAMARGMISLVTPVAALVSAALPAIVGMLRGEALGQLQIVGMVLALIAVTVISRPVEGDPPGGTTLAGGGGRLLAGSGTVFGLSVIAGIGFAGFFLAMDNARAAGGDVWWPIVSARAVGSVLVIAAVIVTRTVPRSRIAVLPLLLVAAVGDIGGILFFSIAIASGPLSLAAVLASMYPVATVLLAWLLLRERLGRAHLAGVILALAGVVLIAI